MPSRSGVGAALLLAALPLGAAAMDEGDARYWLDQMARAIQSLSYEGTFVHLHGERLEAMRIIHRAGEDGERERLIALNGAAREVIRDDEKVTCVLPDSQSVVVDRARPRKPFPSALPRNLEALSEDYTFEVVGRERMTGRAARVIAVRPRDRYRYGHRFWLDHESNMPLKADLIDERGRVLEQVMFTQLQMREDIPDDELLPALDGEGYTWQRVGQPAEGGRPTLAPFSWRVTEVPRGFMLTHHNQHGLPAGGERVEHMVYSDGLASVSVFVERDEDPHRALQGLSSMGAVNAYGRRVAGHQITVVGEVPRATVEMMARSARRMP